MDENIRESLDHFGGVWQRVSAAGDACELGKAPDGAAADVGQLREFMQDEADDAALYGELSRRLRGGASQALAAMAADERGHLRCLQLEYYLLTGDTCAPVPAAPEIGGILARLRQAYISEGQGSRAYAEAAKKTSNEELRCIWEANSRDEAEHRRTLRGLIAQAMC